MPKVLLVLTSHSELGDSGEKTGFNVAEAAHPWKVFREAGFDVEFASTQGGRPPADRVDESDPVQKEFATDPAVQAQLAATPKARRHQPQ